MPPARRRPKSRPPKRSHSALPLVIGSLVIGLVMARWLANKTRNLAGTAWTEVSELRGVSIAEFTLANGQTLSLSDDTRPHVVYLFQYDCAVCDAQRAHVAELLEAAPAGQVVSATAQPAALSPGYWGDFGSPLAQPVGADSAWLAARHLDQLPMMLFVDRSGRVTRAIRGSLLSWSERAFLESLKSAGAG
jgi:hypothetical protein